MFIIILITIMLMALLGLLLGTSNTSADNVLVCTMEKIAELNKDALSLAPVTLLLAFFLVPAIFWFVGPAAYLITTCLGTAIVYTFLAYLTCTLGASAYRAAHEYTSQGYAIC